MAFMDADAIVIGAGAAGMSAALSLSRRGRRVIVLDARDRVGGRIWSCPKAGKVLSAELGAEFIHGRAQTTMALLREAGTSSITISAGESWTCGHDGVLRRERNDFREGAALFREASALQNDESVEEFLQRCARGKATIEQLEWARAFVEGFDAADPERASVKAIAQEWQSGVDSSSARPRGGYAPILQLLHDACVAAGSQFRLCTTVHRVVRQRGSAVVHATNQHGESLSFQSRTAIVTLPAGVLHHAGDDGRVVFEPDLPPEKQEALRYIEMGPVVKVALWFRTRFWERLAGGRFRNGAFFHSENERFPTFWTQLPLRTELIIAWIAGPRAAKLDASASEELIEGARDAFGDLFGERALARNEFDEGMMHGWSRDPYARGAYSYVLVGGANARAALAAPVDDTLFFAGEATSTDGQGGTVNGALETGQRAATQAATALEERLHA